MLIIILLQKLILFPVLLLLPVNISCIFFFNIGNLAGEGALGGEVLEGL